MTGDITVNGGDDKTKAAFKNCHPFTKSYIHLNDEHLNTSENLDLIMNMYNLIEYSDNYANSTASLYQFKRQDKNYGNNRNIAYLSIDSPSFKYKSTLLGNSIPKNAGANPNNPLVHRLWKNAQIMVPLKYVSNFFRSCELLFINTKLYIKLDWTKNSIMSTGGDNSTKFQITKTELYIPVVTLKNESNNKLNDLLETGFERSVIWNEYKTSKQAVTQAQNHNNFK